MMEDSEIKMVLGFLLKAEMEIQRKSNLESNMVGLDARGLSYLWDFCFSLSYLQPDYLICPILQKCGM